MNNADVYDMPEPVFTAANPHTARDTAVPDKEVPADHWRKDPVEIFYPYAKPAPGEMQNIGRLKPGMGHSAHPRLCLSLDGTNNGPTTHGGGGTNPSLDWLWGERQMANTVFWRQLTTVVEFYGIASLSLIVQAFHTSFCPDGWDLTPFLKDCVNQGWPAGSAYHMARSIAEFLAQPANMPAMPVAAVTPSQHISLTTAPTDAPPAHLLLTYNGEFQGCVLMKQPTPRTAKVVVCDSVEVVQARRMWPWVPEAQGARVSSTIASGEERLSYAAEVCFAKLCAPRGSRHWDEDSDTDDDMPAAVAEEPDEQFDAAGEPTHMYLGSANQWCPCTLLDMVSFQWCAVDVGNGLVTQVATALMAEYDATLVGQHVAAPASRKVFAAPTQDTVDHAAAISPEAGSGGQSALRFGQLDLRKQLFAALMQPRGGKKSRRQLPTTPPQKAAQELPTEADWLAGLTAFPGKDWAVPMHQICPTKTCASC